MAGFLKVSYFLFDARVAGRRAEVKGVGIFGGHDGRGEETPGLNELREFCRDKIGGYKIPKRMIVAEAILRNHTGKILRAPLVELATAFKASS